LREFLGRSFIVRAINALLGLGKSDTTKASLVTSTVTSIESLINS